MPGHDRRDRPREVVNGGRLDKVPSRPHRPRLDGVHPHRAPHHAAPLEVRRKVLDGAAPVPVSVLCLSGKGRVNLNTSASGIELASCVGFLVKTCSWGLLQSLLMSLFRMRELKKLPPP